MAITRAQQVRQMLKEGSEKPVEQAGVMNYMPSEMVTVPKIAKSSPDTPTAKLAYITPEEQNILIDLNLYGSLDGKPNRGPGGIPSLEGDFGSPTGQVSTDAGSFGGPGGTYGGGDQKDVSDRRDTGTGDYQRVKEKDVQKAREQRAKQINASKEAEARRQAAIEFEKRQKAAEEKKAKEKKAKQKAAQQKAAKKKKFDLFALSNLTRKGLYNIFPNNPDTELAFLSGLSQEQVDALDNKELSDLYGAIQDADFSGDLSFEDALGDKYGKLSFDAFDALSKRGIDTNFQDPQGEFGNMDFAEYAARIKGKPGLLFSGNVGNVRTIKNPDGTYSFVEGQDDRGPGEGNNPILPIIPKPTDPTTPAVDPTRFRFMNRGGMVEDAPMGGIMDLDTTRQMLFIGGIAKGISKGIKGITRAAKKVVKSPLGKAAILGAIGFGIPRTSFTGLLGGKGASFSLGDILKKGLLKDSTGAFSLENLSGGKIAALSGLAGLIASKQTEEDDFDIDKYYEQEGLRNYIASLGPRYRLETFNAAKGGKAEPVAKKVMPLLDMDGKEMDLRDDGGFVPIGRMEKADDVPARLSKNEFVFTADAVRNAGEGDVDKGAEVMYNMMKNLESGGDVSEESQGLEGAREMFQTAQRLEGVM